MNANKDIPVKSTDTLAWVSNAVLMLTAVVACGGNGSNAEAQETGNSTANGSSSEASAGGSTTRTQNTGIGGKASATKSTANPSCSSVSLGLGSRCPAVEQCMRSQCSSQLTSCYGDEDAKGNRTGGLCQSYTSCIEGCNCESACVRDCSAQEDQACRDCTSTILDCVQASCVSEATACVNNVLGGTAGAPSVVRSSGVAGSFSAAGAASVEKHTCVDLQACCARLTGTAQTNCQTYYSTAASYGDSGCSLAWRSMGC